MLVALGFTMTTKAATVYADLVPGIDPTGYSQITGGLLYQLIAQGHASTNRGFVIVTNAAPIVTGDSAYLTNYLWVDISTDPPVQKLYSGSSGWVTATIGLLAVGSNNIAANAINSSKILDATIGTVDIANNAITTPLIGSVSVTMDKIANGAVGINQLAPNAVGPGAITNNAINTTNIVDGAVTTNKLAGFINGSLVLTNTLTSNNITPQSINGYDLQNGTVSRTNLIPQSIIGNLDIVPASITVGQLSTQMATNFITCWGLMNSNGTLIAGYNMTAVRTSTGVYTITPGTASSNYCIMLTPLGVTATSVLLPVPSIKATTCVISNFTYTLGATVDGPISIQIVGGQQ